MTTTGRGQFAEIEFWRRVQSLSEIEYSPVSWLVEPFIPRGSFVLLVGKPGTYKSWLTLDLARAVARGENFAGMSGGPAREVLYIDRENGESVVARRREIFHIPASPRLRYWGRWSSLPLPAIGSQEMIEFAQKSRPLLIFDSLVRFHKGNENDNAAMAAVMDGFVELARKGATVVVLHHASSKDADKNFRGATEIEAAPDIAARVDRIADRTIRVRQFKNRITEERSFTLTWTQFGFESSAARQEGAA